MYEIYNVFFIHIVKHFQKISSEMEKVLQQLKEKAVVAIVGGSDLIKISEQMIVDGLDGNIILM